MGRWGPTEWGVLLLSAVLVFCNLGHYALWDDEAMTAMLGQAVWRTGDTSVVRGENVIGYQDGMLIRGGKDRYQPPLQFYLAAPFVGLGGDSALAARVPFAVCGLACVALLVWWVRRDAGDRVTRGLYYVGIVTSVAMFLFFRQARYYPVGILLSVVVAYLYLHYDGRRRTVVAIAVAMVLLLLTDYLDWAALCAGLVVDYLAWGRGRMKARPAWRDLLVVAVPQALVVAWILWARNPLAMAGLAEHQGANTLAEKGLLLLFCFRDLNAHEFAPLLVLMAAPFVYLLRRDAWLPRAFVCLIVYLAAMAVLMPTSVARTAQAEVRHFAPIIPLCIALQVMVLRAVCDKVPTVAGAGLVGLVFFTNVLHVPLKPAALPYLDAGVRSTQWAFVAELVDPPTDPFTEASAWLKGHAVAGQSVWVVPPYAAYPLMFRAPGLVYAWQFPPERPGNVPAGLGDVHFRGRVAPDWVVMFGVPSPANIELFEGLQQKNPYELVAGLDVYGRDVFRPEIARRSFTGVSGYNRERDGVYVFRRQ